MSDAQARTRAGLLLGIGAYLIWGLMPLYFRLIAQVPAAEIVAHRVVWSLLFLTALIALRRGWKAVRAALERRSLAILIATALLIGVNWLVFTWAATHGHVVAASLGYYLNPLVNILLGVLLLKERLSRAQIAATALAAVGVAVLAFGAGAGTGLWISLSLAASFALYGFLRKIAPAGALEGLTVETALMAPLALGWIAAMQASGTAGFTAHGPAITTLVALGGVITSVPLLLFTGAARRLPYSTLGFLQYIAPTLQFLIGVFYGEPLTTAHLICFGAIWTALALVAIDGWRAARRARVTEPL
ncbi:EamA family transporter RarD [Sphingosinicella sp.]|uniref:EamA family transporter RarD n=1 Tax=Sphingosinicella sp. TaxID=1917971 RepID=UPI004037F51B